MEDYQRFSPSRPQGPGFGRPDNFPVAMAYVPWQRWNTVYDLEKGLPIGTIFPELNKPFLGVRRMQIMAQKAPTRQQMLQWVNMVSFAVTEANLYLDTHPDDAAALAYFQEYSRLRNQALEDYASMFGPLTVDTAKGSRKKWEWVNNPWPWEGGAC